MLYTGTHIFSKYWGGKNYCDENCSDNQSRLQACILVLVYVYMYIEYVYVYMYIEYVYVYMYIEYVYVYMYTFVYPN